MKTNPKAYKNAPEQHKAACRTLLYALGLMESNGWLTCKTILKARLNQRELACIAFAALRALNEEERQKTIEMSYEIDAPAGYPNPYGNIKDDAQWWASIASQHEHEAYLMAAYKQLPKKSKNDLKEYLAGE